MNPARLVYIAVSLLFGVGITLLLVNKHGYFKTRAIVEKMTIAAFIIIVVMLVIKIIVFAITGETLPF